MAQRKILEKEWRFIQKDILNAKNEEYDDNNWEEINIPHTWNAFDVQSGGGKRKDTLVSKSSAYFRGIGWYRRRISLPNVENKRYFIDTI